MLHGVEAQELDWVDEWSSMELMMINKPDSNAAVKPDRGKKERKKPVQGTKHEAKKDDSKVGKMWFCRDFNTQLGCTLQAHTQGL